MLEKKPERAIRAETPWGVVGNFMINIDVYRRLLRRGRW